MPDLAVIMSVYRNDKLQFVRESVQSILNQTFSAYDYYIVFDGPVMPDVDDYISSLKDKRIKLYRLEKNGGLAGALNYLLEIVLKNSDYKLIARMDADDISMPDRFEKQYNFLSENNEIACVGSWFEEIDESAKHLANRKLPVTHDALKKRYYIGTPFAHPSVMYRRELIEKAGFYPTGTLLMEDNVLWGRALRAGLKFSNIPEFLFKFRIDKDFYWRRSGFKYGLSYMRTKMKLNRTLKAPLYADLFAVSRGLMKMLPAVLLKPVYLLERKLNK